MGPKASIDTVAATNFEEVDEADVKRETADGDGFFQEHVDGRAQGHAESGVNRLALRPELRVQAVRIG